MKNKPFILLISGPSGAGKSTLLRLLFEEFGEELYFSISSTTRPARPGERPGEHYFFVSREDFEAGVAAGDFLEWAWVHENLYGTSLAPTRAALARGRVVVFDIDVQGFRLARERLEESIVSVFITTKNSAELRARLLKRGSDDPKDLDRRLANASEEMGAINEYDFLIINEDLGASYEALRSIFISGRFRADLDLAALRSEWQKS